LLNSKNIGTELRIAADELIALRPDGKTRYRERTAAGKTRGAAAALSQALTKAHAGCWVHAVIVVWGDMTDRHVASQKLDWVAGPDLVNWLCARPMHRDPDRVRQAREALVGGQLDI
jgi:hypothetical protein